jgi:hypothetical protein
MDAISGDHGGGVLDEGEVVVAGLGGVDSKIEHSGQFCPVKPKIERGGLDIGALWTPLVGTMVVVC